MLTHGAFFRYYGVIIPCIMNLISMVGFSVLGCILGGQALASVTDDHLSWTSVSQLVTIIGIVSY